MTFDWVNLLVSAVLVSRYKHRARASAENFSGGATIKKEK